MKWADGIYQTEMSFELGPQKFERITLGSKILDIEVSKAEPILLAFTNDHKIDEFYLRDLDKKGVITHPLPMKSLHVACRPCNFGLSGKNIVHCDEDILKINNRHEIMHKSSINHLLLDDEYIGLTTCEDSVLVNSIARGELLADLHYYGDTITALFWTNSLAISGDSRGMVNLWDINKQKIVNSNLIHASKVDYIQAYADYVYTNFYYTVSNQERRASFHDLRTYRPIKITNNLPAYIIDVRHNPTGKIFLATEKEVQFIDVYQGFSPIGKFCGVSSQRMQIFMRDHPDSDYDSRLIRKMMIWDNHVIVGCSNGCIQVYDSDLLTCLYSYGMCQFSGVKQMKRLNNSLIVLEEKGMISAAKLI